MHFSHFVVARGLNFIRYSTSNQDTTDPPLHLNCSNITVNRGSSPRNVQSPKKRQSSFLPHLLLNDGIRFSYDVLRTGLDILLMLEMLLISCGSMKDYL